MGAVELSLIELNGCYLKQAPEQNPCLYVTDLVTLWTYRRMGIGKALTKAIEEEACDRGAAWLLLHVEPEASSPVELTVAFSSSKELQTRQLISMGMTPRTA